MASRKADIAKLRPVDVYIALDDLDFAWLPEEVETVINCWDKGYDIRVMSEELEREEDEIALLIMDLARKEKIKYRSNGVYGIFKKGGE